MMMKMSRLFAAPLLSPCLRQRAQTLCLLAFAMAFSLLVCRAQARPTPPSLEDPAHWATVTHPGNAPYTLNLPFNQTRQIGQVNYEYRISKTEVTTADWVEFVNAYKPHLDPAYRFSPLFTSFNLRIELRPDGTVDYTSAPGAENYAIDVGFRFAARYVNWLHNNKGANRDAFENGAYDTSTFGDLPGFQFTDQGAHTPGAKFWIATENEWVKAAFYDPHKNGQDMPGYWRYPITSDAAPISGPPGVGQTSAGSESGGAYPVGSYTNATSPWGLFDLSGGEKEWCEDVLYDRFTGLPGGRTVRGTYSMNNSYLLYDKIDGLEQSATMQNGFGGIRLASLVPAPSAISGMALLSVSLLSRRRR